MYIIILGNILILLTIVIWILMRDKKAKRIIYDWAHNKKYKIVEVKYLLFGPFYALFKFSKAQMYYEVKVQDDNKSTILILKIGGYWSGLFNEKVEVERMTE